MLLSMIIITQTNHKMPEMLGHILHNLKLTVRPPCFVEKICLVTSDSEVSQSHQHEKYKSSMYCVKITLFWTIIENHQNLD